MSDDILLDDIVEEGKLVSLAEVKDMLEKAQKQREDMTYEQKIALEHARRFARLDGKAARALVADVRKAFPQIEEKYAVRLADLVPQHADDVQGVLQKARLDLSDDDLESILGLIDKHYVA